MDLNGLSERLKNEILIIPGMENAVTGVHLSKKAFLRTTFKKDGEKKSQKACEEDGPWNMLSFHWCNGKEGKGFTYGQIYQKLQDWIATGHGKALPLLGQDMMSDKSSFFTLPIHTKFLVKRSPVINPYLRLPEILAQINEGLAAQPTDKKLTTAFTELVKEMGGEKPACTTTLYFCQGKLYSAEQFKKALLFTLDGNEERTEAVLKFTESATIPNVSQHQIKILSPFFQFDLKEPCTIEEVHTEAEPGAVIVG